jgi:ubiquinol-cytochrome c reductase cytochrome c1 subunit
MVRVIAIFAGLTLFVALMVGAFAPREASAPDLVKKYHLHATDVAFSFEGPFGTYDKAQLQRGLKVFKESCSACHGLKQVAFRSLTDLGYNEAQVKVIAKEWANKTPSVDEKTGEATTRDAIPSDKMIGPYPNEVAARAANNNAYPPDLSLITKGRHDGSQYVHSLIAGYGKKPAADWEVPEGLHYNPYFSNLNIAMPPPLVADDQVTYDDGTKASVDQMATDVAAFLTWAAEPKLEARHRTGFGVMIFLLILTGLSYLSYRRVWADQKVKPSTTA